MLQKLIGLAAMLALVVTVACTQTDADLAKAVQDRFASDPIVRSYHLDVSSEKKVVSIKGTVDTSVAKDQALQIARATTGVLDVQDHVAVRDNEGTRSWLNRSSGAIGTSGIRP
jgi:osmotically-inducible protein OsmY